MKLPDGVNVSVDQGTISVKGPKGQLSRVFDPQRIIVDVQGTDVTVSPNAKKATRELKSLAGTFQSHIANMAQGVVHGFEVKLQLVYSHFPVSLEVKGQTVAIKNFLGEKNPRHAKVVGSTQVDVKSQSITVSGIDKEAVGQTAANLISATGVGHRDERVFQDGIYYA
ncbi:50S ribosomal protein L6 [Candidatus Micrarchaeota archaeon]|nr:50S ribosomal protein L6 [Candidatus Micrarchaeota archaeon]